MRRLSRFLRLSTAERRLLIEAMLLLGAIRPGLWLLPFETVRRLLARAARMPAGSQEVDLPSAERVVWALAVASRYAPRGGAGTCLTQALAAQTMLARRGHPALLRIGLTKDEERRLQAHAWVESAGKVVIGGSANLERYTLLPALEGKKP
jgi:hypothetical protein